MPAAAAATSPDLTAPRRGGLVRIGEAPELGELLLRLLELNGWKVHRRRAFAGNGVLLIATHPSGYDVRAEGPSLAAASTPLFVQAAEIRPPKDGQLVLPV